MVWAILIINKHDRDFSPKNFSANLCKAFARYYAYKLHLFRLLSKEGNITRLARFYNNNTRCTASYKHILYNF